MYILSNLNKELVVQPTRNLYRWSKIFNRLQRDFFIEETKLRREKQIEDFITLNGFKKVKFKTDTDVFNNFVVERCEHSTDADITVITDQKFSRYPCPEIINQIQLQLTKCSKLYLCLNRHYINIDNSYHDSSLDASFTLAVTQWLKKELPEVDIIDMSLDYVDYGNAFTWAIPDRHFFIKLKND
jgi:hypothetical protein